MLKLEELAFAGGSNDFRNSCVSMMLLFNCYWIDFVREIRSSLLFGSRIGWLSLILSGFIPWFEAW